MLALALKELNHNEKRYRIVKNFCTLGFSLLYFILQLIGFMRNNISSELDYDLVCFLEMFVFAVMGCICFSIRSVFYMIYKERKNEIHTLSRIGTSNKTIKRTFILELIILNLLVIIENSIVGAIVMYVFIKIHKLKYIFDLHMFIIFLILTIVLFMSIGLKQINRIFKEVVAAEKGIYNKPKKLKVVSIKKLRLMIILETIIGVIFIICRKFIQQNNIKFLIIIIGISILIQPIVLVINEVLKFIFEKLKLQFLSVALRQIHYNFSKVVYLVGIFSTSIIFMIVVFTLYNSINISELLYTDSNMKYTSLVELDDVQPKESFKENENLFKGLSLNANFKEYDDILIVGIDKGYLDFETLDFATGSIEELFNVETLDSIPRDIEYASKDDNAINCIIPELMRIENKLKINDTFKMYVLGKNFKFKVVGTVYTYNYDQIFVDSQKLSQQVLGKSDLINDIYIKDNYKDIYKELDSNNISYTPMDRHMLLDEYRDEILKQPDMIKIYWYGCLVVNIILIINMLLVSIEEKKRYSYVYENLGLTTSKIRLMNVMETIIISIAGIFIGITLGTVLNSDLSQIAEVRYGVRIDIFPPVKLFVTICIGAELIIVFAAFIVSIFSSNTKSLRLLGREE